VWRGADEVVDGVERER